ncbi:hypothetical protein [Urbanus proteus nucleopolyhedrovirus]|uniref:PIF-7 n=1 Tax=Urbanus proteus nucleopolyhedrovirus TaxID=1675866 RepID=A0A161C6W6_9ABAC|nr:hypothetical protein [Urbanus proteus nucleopolyhedrovirus]AKR17315.1 hypothetical protein [Urbanus proteus nucleopolyhedrovirus]
MIVYMILACVLFFGFVAFLFQLKINKKQLRNDLFFQYKFIPENLLPFVRVVNLKNYDLSLQH